MNTQQSTVKVNGQSYKVDDDGRIVEPGKFERELSYVPYFYDLLGYSGQVDEVEYYSKLIYKLKVNQEDREQFESLEGVDHVYLYEDNYGFVNEVEFDEESWKEITTKSSLWSELEDFTNRLEVVLDFVEVNNIQPYNSTTILIDWSQVPDSEPDFCVPRKVKELLQQYNHIFISDFVNCTSQDWSTIQFIHSSLNNL